MNELTGAEIAQFDQAWAQAVELYDKLVNSYRTRRREDAANGLPEPVTIVSLSIWLSEEWEPDLIGSALACAVVYSARLQEDLGA